MQSDIRSIIGKYGMRAVHEGLMKEMRDTFHYLQEIFEVKNEIVQPLATHVLPVVEIVNNIIPETILQSDDILSFIPDDDSLDEEVNEMPKDPTVKEITIGSNKTKAMPVILSPPAIDVKQQKAKHREEVDTKRQDLITKGVKPESLLTEVNLRKWLGDGQSYLKIAKETGVHEQQVALIAKGFGLQSNISKYVAMKKTK